MAELKEKPDKEGLTAELESLLSNPHIKVSLNNNIISICLTLPLSLDVMLPLGNSGVARGGATAPSQGLWTAVCRKILIFVGKSDSC